MTILNVRHRTQYQYAEPVTFGPHRMMMRPRDSHDLRLIDTGLSISPNASMRWLHDVFGNSVAIADFTEPGDELLVVSSFRAEHYPLPETAVTVEGPFGVAFDPLSGRWSQGGDADINYMMTVTRAAA